MTAEDNVALVRRVVDEIWNGLDLGLADYLFAPTYMNHGGLIPDLVTGPEGVKFAVVLQHTAFPRLHIRERAVEADDNLVELQWSAGRNPGRGNERTTPSRRCNARGTTLIRCTGSRISESWTTWRCPALGAPGGLQRRTQSSFPVGDRPHG